MITELSILLPSYNNPCIGLVKELQRQAELIPSLRYEIIVADDGSTDKNVIEANRTINLYKGCKLVECGVNRGRCIIRNFLAESAQHDWLLFLDSDMKVAVPSFINNYLHSDTSPVTCGGLISVNDNGKFSSNLRYRYEQSCKSRFSAEARSISPYKGFHTVNFLIQKRIMLSHPFRTELKGYGYEDVLFGKDLCHAKIEICHIDNPVCMDDFEANTSFLKKTEASCRTLWSLRKEMEGYSQMLKTTETVIKYKLSNIAASIFHYAKPILTRNLTGSNPSVFLYNLYRLGYMVSLANEHSAISENNSNNNKKDIL